jgi:hypothetical protein
VILAAQKGSTYTAGYAAVIGGFIKTVLLLVVTGESNTNRIQFVVEGI